MKKIIQLATCFLFIGILFFLTVCTLWNARFALLETAKNSFVNHNIKWVESTDSVLKEYMWKKNELIALAGFFQKALGKHLVGDGEFYQDTEGIMHMNYDTVPYSDLLYDIEELNKKTKQKGIPLLLCQIAERNTYGDRYCAQMDGEAAFYMEPLEALAAEKNIPLFRYGDIFKKNGYSEQDIFFKTDVHYTTKAEFSILRPLTAYLETFGLHFANKDIVLDLGQYEAVTHPFIGNLGRSVGKFYTGLDSFEHYIPKFETSLKLINPSASLVREGDFASVLINGSLNDPNAGIYTYWITDYMQYPSPYYTIENNLINENHILVIGDSMSMRTIAYLSLLCQNVTFLDPRSFGNTDYLTQELDQNQYDAVLVMPAFSLSGGIGGYNADISNVISSLSTTNHGTYDLSVTVLNTGSTSWSNAKNIGIMLWNNGTDSSLRANLPQDAVIAPGESYTFIFSSLSWDFLSQNLSVQMLREGSFYFGKNQILYNLTPDHPKELDARIISCITTAPDNTNRYTADVVVQNVGSSTWTEDDKIRLCVMRNNADTGFRIFLPSKTQIAPGETYKFSVDYFVLPEQNTRLEYQMLKETVMYFGERKGELIHDLDNAV